MSPNEETLHVTPKPEIAPGTHAIAALHHGGELAGLIGRNGVVYTRPLIHKPNTIHFTSASTCYAVLQSMHRLAVGNAAHAAVSITGVNDAGSAKDIYRKTRAAAIAFYVAASPAKRRALFHALLAFVTQHTSFDGLEGLFLTGLRAQEEEGNTAQVQQAVQVLRSVGVGATRDMGATGSVFLDMERATLLSMNGADLKAVGTGWTGTGSAVFGSYKLPEKFHLNTGTGRGRASAVPVPPPRSNAVSPGLPGAPGLPGSGLQGGGALGGSVIQAVKDAGNSFLAEIFGQEAANEIGTAFQIIGSDAAEGATVGALAGGSGSIIGGVIGFIYGLFDAQSVLAGQKALDDLNAELDGLIKTLDDLIVSLGATGTDSTPGDSTGGATASTDPDTGDDTETPSGDDTPGDPDHPDTGGDMAVGDAGDDNGSDTGGGANNVDVNTNWPPLIPQGGGSSGDPGDGGDGLGKAHPMPTMTKGGGTGGFAIDDGLGSDTGLHQLPPGTVLVGGTADHSGDLDGLGKVHPVPNPGALLSGASPATVRKLSLTNLGGGAVQVTTKT